MNLTSSKLAMDNSFPDSILKAGSKKWQSTTARTTATKLYSIDSARNWPIIWLRSEPSVLRNPTSFARLVDCAVDMFMKLIQAIAMIKMPIPPKT
jgi:hypothetical protein